MVATKEEVVQLLRQKGPLVPNDIKRELGGDTLIVGAMLSELASRGIVKITDVKKGGSPFYYLPDQTKRLEQLTEYLNSKDQNTVRILQDQKVVADKSMELLERVSLRKIKDYAKELQVNTAQGKMLFWRYYLVTQDDAISILKERYASKPDAASQQKMPSSETTSSSETVVSMPSVKISEQVATNDSSDKDDAATKQPASEPNSSSSTISEQPSSSQSRQQKLPVTHHSSSLESTPYLDTIHQFFKTKHIEIHEEEQLSKNREYAFVVTVQSAVGPMKMYAVARNKKKLNQQDVAPALLQAKMKNLPCIFLYNGEFSKKGLEIIETDYTGILLVSLE